MTPPAFPGVRVHAVGFSWAAHSSALTCVPPQLPPAAETRGTRHTVARAAASAGRGSCRDAGLQPADAAPHGPRAPRKRWPPCALKPETLSASNRQMMYGKLISNGAKNCSPCRPDSPAQLSSIDFHPIQSVQHKETPHTLNFLKHKAFHFTASS